jgi:PRTRC genetic system protein E
MFFTQLAKLTATTQIKILMTGVAGGDKINLIIDPRPLGDAKNAPPLAPMTFTATPEELDAELPALLANYADRTVSMFSQFESQMLEIEQNAANKVAEKKGEAAKKTAPAARTIATKAATVKPASTSSKEEGDEEEADGESGKESVVVKPAVKSAAEQQTSLLELF